MQINNRTQKFQPSLYGDSGACNININCSAGSGWQNEKNVLATGGVVVYPVAFDVNNGCDININGLTAGLYIIAISYDGASYGVTVQKN